MEVLLNHYVKGVNMEIIKLLHLQHYYHNAKIPDYYVYGVLGIVEVFIEVTPEDMQKANKRITNEILKIEKKRDKVASLLGNENFIKNAPIEVLTKHQLELKQLNNKIEKLKVNRSRK